MKNTPRTLEEIDATIERLQAGYDAAITNLNIDSLSMLALPPAIAALRWARGGEWEVKRKKKSTALSDTPAKKTGSDKL